ncbi:hypothetical protein CA54_10200 [Symmachiella macrocystis]|uniref:Uncharacterized protein n=1 Tax=Symmachiella macrocystis TaxID=2527985 RepID=A0A5C6BKC7_9PLAN|nr:hypothetical protein CA54_10200 [Symmachiella macrocystis]
MKNFRLGGTNHVSGRFLADFCGKQPRPEQRHPTPTAAFLRLASNHQPVGGRILGVCGGGCWPAIEVISHRYLMRITYLCKSYILSFKEQVGKSLLFKRLTYQICTVYQQNPTIPTASGVNASTMLHFMRKSASFVWLSQPEDFSRVENRFGQGVDLFQRVIKRKAGP